MKIVDAIDYMIKDTKTQNYFIKGSNFFDNMKIIVQQFIDMIDKNNAISAIGTLEFLDQLAKFNKVSNICRADFNIDNTAKKAIELPNMEPLYGINKVVIESGSGSDDSE